MTTSFRAPGARLSLDELLARARPDSSPPARERLVSRGAISIGGRPARRLKTRVEPGRLVEVRGEAPGTRFEAADSWYVLVPGLPWRAGRLDCRSESGNRVARKKGSGVVFEQLDEQRGLCELRVRGAADAVRAALAAAGCPVLGDVEHAGILVAGGVRLVAAAGARPAGWWPEEPVFPESGPLGGLNLGVSDATRRVLRRGHPWVLRDDYTGDASCFAPGTRVELVAGNGEALGTAHVEGSGRLTARIWTASGAVDASVEARVATALKRRGKLLEAQQTDAYRLVHGEAERLPGLFIDRLGSLLRVLVTSPGTGAYRNRALDAVVRGLRSQLGSNPPVVETLHLRDRPAGTLECTRLVRGDASSLAEALVVREADVGYCIDPGLERPERARPGVGLYLDQRVNRERLLAAVPAGRLLNLFAHTGAFSVAWLASGREQAVSVDLSGAYLRRLEQNLELNGIDLGRHRSVKQDARRFLESLEPSERFEAIVLDPPTAASAGHRFWSVARELSPLVSRALSHLSPGGVLLVSRNDRRRSKLRELVARAAEESGVPLAGVRPAPPGSDFPRLAGFAEGDPFSAVIATRASG